MKKMMTSKSDHKNSEISKFFIDHKFPVYSLIGIIKIKSFDDKGRPATFSLQTNYGEEFEIPNFHKRRNKSRYIGRTVKINTKILDDINGQGILLDGYKIEKIFQKKSSYKVHLEDVLN